MMMEKAMTKFFRLFICLLILVGALVHPHTHESPFGGSCYHGRPFHVWQREAKNYARFEDACWWINMTRPFGIDDHGPPPTKKRIEVIEAGKWSPTDPFDAEDVNPDPAAVPVLTPLLDEREKVVRAYAARRLGAIGPPAREAIPALIRLLQDQDPGLKGIAAETLGSIGTDANESVPLLLAILKDKRPSFRLASIRSRASAALTKIDPQTAAKVPHLLTRGMRDEDWDDFERFLGIPPKTPAAITVSR
jgi:hypothetical protein